jgi:hypothetical protein
MKKTILKIIRWTIASFFTEKTGPEVKKSERNFRAAKAIIAIDNLICLECGSDIAEGIVCVGCSYGQDR